MITEGRSGELSIPAAPLHRVDCTAAIALPRSVLCAED